MGKRVAVIHYMPLEIYPPVMNLVRTWDKMNHQARMDIYTTGFRDKALRFTPVSGTTRVTRFGLEIKKNGLQRLAHYAHYYLSTLFMLLITRPENVLYFDTISSFPAIMYKMIFRKKCRLLVHYNEYMSAAEYSGGMFLVRYFHKLEQKIYAETAWVSHTNPQRMQLFLQDMPGVTIPHQHTLPNFPPAAWASAKKRNSGIPFKIVYTGALSMDTMYTKLFAEWVIKQEGNVTWDIYSLNNTPEAGAYINSLPGNYIRLHQGVDYYQLPAVLANYDAGVILYNGHIPNYVYNAPNKLFEYASAGLDVWLPQHMESSLQYVTHGTYPAIISLDFTALQEIQPYALSNTSGFTFRPHPFSCEAVLKPLLDQLAV
jgi:hypothetical protein